MSRLKDLFGAKAEDERVDPDAPPDFVPPVPAPAVFLIHQALRDVSQRQLVSTLWVADVLLDLLLILEPLSVEEEPPSAAAA